jgi:hypothetical protein
MLNLGSPPNKGFNPNSQCKGLFASVVVMEERITALMRNALKGVKVNPVFEPRLIAVARRAIKIYGADDNAVINAIIMAREALISTECKE